MILQGDGMPDHKLPELGNKTPLEVADTPNLDQIAKIATCFGMVKTIPDQLPPGSDVGNLVVLGYNPLLYYTGRSPLEAASIGVELKEGDVALRCNLVTLSPDNSSFVMKDYSAGHISTEEAHKLISSLKAALDNDEFEFFPGVSYRHLVVWHGGNKDIVTTPPHDISEKEITRHLPQGKDAEKLIQLMEQAQTILKDHPVNKKRIKEGKEPATHIWLWGQGTAPSLPPFRELHGIEGAIISAVDLVKGIGYYAKMRVIEVPEATGYLDTNYKGKVEYALRSLEEVDLVMIHIEATDETGHIGKAELKIQAIEDFDKKVVGPVLEGIKQFGNYRILVLSDHPTPIDLRTHVNEPVPFAVVDSTSMEEKNKDYVYTEECATKTSLFIEEGWKLLGMVINNNLPTKI